MVYWISLYSRFWPKLSHQQVGYEYEEEIVYHPGRSWQRACDVSCLNRGLSTGAMMTAVFNQTCWKTLEWPGTHFNGVYLLGITVNGMSMVFWGRISWRKNISLSFHWGLLVESCAELFLIPRWMLADHQYWRALGAMWLAGAHRK